MLFTTHKALFISGIIQKSIAEEWSGTSIETRD